MTSNPKLDTNKPINTNSATYISYESFGYISLKNREQALINPTHVVRHARITITPNSKLPPLTNKRLDPSVKMSAPFVKSTSSGITLPIHPRQKQTTINPKPAKIPAPADPFPSSDFVLAPLSFKLLMTTIPNANAATVSIVKYPSKNPVTNGAVA